MRTYTYNLTITSATRVFCFRVEMPLMRILELLPMARVCEKLDYEHILLVGMLHSNGTGDFLPWLPKPQVMATSHQFQLNVTSK